MRRLSFILLALTAALLAVISMGGGIAGWPSSLYSSLPMMLMWCATAAVSVICMARLKLWRRPVIALLHVALVVILAGALLSHLASVEHEAHLRGGVVDGDFTLVSCAVLTYPGTDTPRDYSAVITDGNGDTVTVSLNHPASVGDTRLMLKSFDSDAEGVTLIITSDRWGRAVTFGGYILLAIAMLLYFFMPHTAWRRAITQMRRVGVASAILCTCAISTEATTLTDDMSETLMHTAVFHNGRICPIGTLARDFTVTVTGSGSIDGHSSSEVFEGFLFDFGTWRRLQVIKVKDDNLRQLLDARGGRCSYEQWFAAVASGAVDLDDPETQRRYAADIARFEAVNMLVSGALLKFFPVEVDGTVVWYAPTDRLPTDLYADRWMFIRKFLGLLNEQVLLGDQAQVVRLLDALCRYQRSVAVDLPSPRRLKSETLYNRLSSSPIAVVAAVICAVMMVCGLLVSSHVGRRRRRAGVLAVACLWLWITALTVMRWYVSRHVPLANGYDTMMLMAWIAASVALLCSRNTLILASGALICALAMAVAAMSGSGASVTPLMPVLSSPLLTVHVLLVMTSYVLFALMAFIALYGLTAGRGRVEYYSAVCSVMLYPAIMALGAGIFVGAVWADVAWGRYWGWDPKEVWALITFIIYAIAAHRGLRFVNTTPRCTLRYLSLAFVSVVVTYWGVNYLLGGLHSYA